MEKVREELGEENNVMVVSYDDGGAKEFCDEMGWILVSNTFEYYGFETEVSISITVILILSMYISKVVVCMTDYFLPEMTSRARKRIVFITMPNYG